MVIEEYHFGRIKINGVIYRSDIKITSAGVILHEWWRKKGHIVEIEDIEDILEDIPDVLVIGKGKPGLMKTSQQLKRYLEKQHITLVEEASSKAVKVVNKLFADKVKFAAGFHLTC